MKKIFLAASLFLFTAAFSCSSDDKETKSQAELLTNGSTKSWKLVFDSSDEDQDDESCKVGSPQTVDNQFIFNTNGSFRFDNGNIIEIEDCEDCCSDILDVVGNWEIYSGGDSLSVVITGRIDDGIVTPFDENTPLLRSKLIKLTESEMELQEYDLTAKFNPF